MHWMRWKEPETAAASVWAAVVLARSGTDSSRMCPARDERGGQRQAQALLAHHPLGEGVRHAVEELGGALDVRLGRGVGPGGALRLACQRPVAGKGRGGSGVGGAGGVGGQAARGRGLRGPLPPPGTGARGSLGHRRRRRLGRRRGRPGGDGRRNGGLSAGVGCNAVGLNWLVAHETPRAPERRPRHHRKAIRDVGLSPGQSMGSPTPRSHIGELDVGSRQGQPQPFVRHRDPGQGQPLRQRLGADPDLMGVQPHIGQDGTW